MTKSARKLLVAGNWKMNHGGASGVELAETIAGGWLADHSLHNVDVMVATPFTILAAVASVLEDSRIGLGAQNLHKQQSGAFTGEISGPMIIESGANWVLVGHSERRQYNGETSDDVAAKTTVAFEALLTPVVCIGETLAERDANSTFAVLEAQLAPVIPVLAKQFANDGTLGVIAYEPVWAIGTGRTASPQQAQEAHAWIRAHLAEKISADFAEKVRLLYGGSVTPANALELFGCTDVDGGLVGGASLRADSFIAIVRAASEVARKAGVA